MSEPFRTRRFQPVPASERPRRRRRAARVVVLHDDEVLLLADTDPGLPGTRWWVTPGGGIDPGESPLQAAVRELHEELGLIATPDELLGPIAVRDVIHGYSDQILEQHEEFFVLPVADRFTPTQDGLTEDEKITLSGWAWLPVDELPSRPEPVWPADLPTMVDAVSLRSAWPLQLGEIEESTLPVE